MLKLNYNDFGLFLERVPISWETVANQRVILAMRSGEPLHLDPSWASFLLPVELSGVTRLKCLLRKYSADAIALTKVDDEFVEVSLKGIWMASSVNAESGTFITALASESEMLIYELWQATQRQNAYFV